MSKKTFNIYIESPAYALTIDEIWPHGYEDERPENPTAKDVVEWIHKNYSSPRTFLSEWGLDATEIYVDQEKVF